MEGVVEQPKKRKVHANTFISSKNKFVDMNEDDPDTIAEASIASDGNVLELIEPTTEEGSSHSVLCIGNDGNDEQEV